MNNVADVNFKDLETNLTIVSIWLAAILIAVLVMFYLRRRLLERRRKHAYPEAMEMPDQNIMPPPGTVRKSVSKSKSGVPQVPIQGMLVPSDQGMIFVPIEAPGVAIIPAGGYDAEAPPAYDRQVSGASDFDVVKHNTRT